MGRSSEPYLYGFAGSEIYQRATIELNGTTVSPAMLALSAAPDASSRQ